MILTKANLDEWEKQGKLCRKSMVAYASAPVAASQWVQLIKYYYGHTNEKR